jgi:hypothetical protein
MYAIREDTIPVSHIVLKSGMNKGELRQVPNIKDTDLRVGHTLQQFGYWSADNHESMRQSTRTLFEDMVTNLEEFLRDYFAWSHWLDMVLMRWQVAFAVRRMSPVPIA